MGRNRLCEARPDADPASAPSMRRRMGGRVGPLPERPPTRSSCRRSMARHGVRGLVSRHRWRYRQSHSPGRPINTTRADGARFRRNNVQRQTVGPSVNGAPRSPTRRGAQAWRLWSSIPAPPAGPPGQWIHRPGRRERGPNHAGLGRHQAAHGLGITADHRG